MTKYTYGQVPDTYPGKQAFPLNKRLFQVYEVMGWDHIISKFDEVASKFTYDNFKYRLDSAIQTAKDVIDGKITVPEKTLGYTLFPPGGFMRSDLQQGSMKLLYGESVDVSYVGLRDDTLNVQIILNGHLEDGIPVDWWIVGEEDEIMDRRHIKTGIKLRDTAKKSKKKNLISYGSSIRDILLDIRNERTPQWTDSTYQVGIGWGSFGAYMGLELSNYEQMGMTFDLLAWKRAYGLPDLGFAYVPMPQMINMIAFMERQLYLKRMIGLSTELNLAINGLSEYERTLLKDAFPEEYEILLPGQWEEGVPYPMQTLESQPPRIKKKNLTDEDLYWKFKDPKEKFIHLEDLGITFEEAMKCVYLNVDHLVEPGSVDLKEKIISTGIGVSTKFF